MMLMNFSEAHKDMWAGICLWKYWVFRAWVQQKLSFNQTRLGLVWPSLSLSIIVVVLGSVWGVILDKNEPGSFFLYLITGYPIWQVISTSVTLGSQGVAEFGKTNGLPMAVIFLERVAAVFLKLVIILPVVAIFIAVLHSNEGFLHMLWLPVAIANLIFWSLSVVVIVSVVTTLLPDFKPLINAVMGLAFLATPIIWEPSRLVSHQYLLWLNPFFLPLEFGRSSLSGQVFVDYIAYYACIYTAILCFVAYVAYALALPKLKFRAS